MAAYSDGPQRRVVVTGIGVISPSGLDRDTFWQNVSSGRSAAGPVTRFKLDECPSHYACEVRDWTPTDYMDAKTVKRFERSLQFGVAAAKKAAEDARIDFNDTDPDRCGIVEATSLSNMEAAYRARDALDARGFRAISPSGNSAQAFIARRNPA